MESQAVAQETQVEQAFDTLDANIITLEESPDGETHEVIGADGEEHTTGVFPPFDYTTFASQILWLAISFAALYYLMSKVALPRIGEIIEVRRDRIEGDLAEADRLRKKTEQAIESYEAALADARAKAHGIAETTRGQIKADLDARRAKVEADLTRRVAAAEASIAETKNGVLAHVDEIAADTAQAVAAQLLGKPTIKAARDAVAKVVKG